MRGPARVFALGLFLAGCNVTGPVLWHGGGDAAGAEAPEAGGGPPPDGGWQLVFSDDFDEGPGTAGFASRWVTQWTWYDDGAWGDSAYNFAVCDCYWSAPSVVGVNPDGGPGSGAVALVAERTPAGVLTTLPFTAGVLSAFHSFSQTYGYFEARARLPGQVGTGGSFSLWARTDLPQWGRVEVAELRGASSRDSGGNPARVVFMASPYTNSWGATVTDGAAGTFTSGVPMDADYHVYGVDWSPGLLVWTIDGVERFRTTVGVPDFPLFPLFFVSAGDPADVSVNGPTSETAFPDQLRIDWVRVWRR